MYKCRERERYVVDIWKKNQKKEQMNINLKWFYGSQGWAHKIELADDKIKCTVGQNCINFDNNHIERWEPAKRNVGVSPHISEHYSFGYPAPEYCCEKWEKVQKHFFLFCMLSQRNTFNAKMIQFFFIVSEKMVFFCNLCVLSIIH